MQRKVIVVNPYRVVRPLVAHNVEMGRQSQQRVSNTKRAHQLAQHSTKASKRKKGDQVTLLGRLAFQPEKDCVVCKAKSIAKFVAGYRVPKRSHHQLCIKNSKTKGKRPTHLDIVISRYRDRIVLRSVCPFQKVIDSRLLYYGC